MVTLLTEVEAEISRKKLAWLEERLRYYEHNPALDPHLQAATLRSFHRLIKQLREELLRFEILQKQTTTAVGKK